MPGLTVGYGIALIVLGLIGYFGTGMLHPDKATSPTALIPAAFGILALILGLVARKSSARKHAMHGAAMLSLLGVLMPVGRLIGAISKGTFDITRPATMAIMAMALLSAIFLALCVRSFITVRRARRLETAE